MASPYATPLLEHFLNHILMKPRASVFHKGRSQADEISLLRCIIHKKLVRRDGRIASALLQRYQGGCSTGSRPHGDVSVLDASSFCAFYLFSCWHTWDRTTAFPLVVQSLFQHRASGTSRHSRHSRSSDFHHQACYTQDRSRSDCPTHLGSRKC